MLLANWLRNVQENVTSDHGFLYNHNEIKTHNRERLPSQKVSRASVLWWQSLRCCDGYQMDLRNTTNLDTDLKVLVPEY